MKKRNVFEIFMHFVVHNSFLFTVAVMCLVHATLLTAMWLGHIMPLVNFNVLSVVVYLFCVILCKFGHIMPVFISIILEVTVYAVASVIFIGWDTNSYCFLFSIVPIIIYFGCFLFKGLKRLVIVAVLAINFLIFVFLYLNFAGSEPLNHISGGIKTFFIIFSTFVMVFSTIFYSMIYIYSSEVEMNTLTRKNERLTADAMEDSLTSLLNRRGFLPLVDELIKERGPHHFCIAFCDIDNFKRINDSYGHDCGDEVLLHISRLIRKEMPGCNICRWGGEEIVILMKDYDLEVAKQKMEYIRRTIESSPTIFFNKHISTTVTIGLEEYRDIYKEPEDIIRVADERMYYGKQNGKNIVIFEDIR